MELTTTILYFVKLKELKRQIDQDTHIYLFTFKQLKNLVQIFLRVFIGGKGGHMWFPLLVLLFSFVV